MQRQPDVTDEAKIRLEKQVLWFNEFAQIVSGVSTDFVASSAQRAESTAWCLPRVLLGHIVTNPGSRAIAPNGLPIWDLLANSISSDQPWRLHQISSSIVCVSSSPFSCSSGFTFLVLSTSPFSPVSESSTISSTFLFLVVDRGALGVFGVFGVICFLGVDLAGLLFLARDLTGVEGAVPSLGGALGSMICLFARA